jgi:hypothetical protein
MTLGACGDNPDRGDVCSAAITKAAGCGATQDQITQEGLCTTTDANDHCAAECLQAASCADIVAYYAGQQMNALGDCLSGCNN